MSAPTDQQQSTSQSSSQQPTSSITTTTTDQAPSAEEEIRRGQQETEQNIAGMAGMRQRVSDECAQIGGDWVGLSAQAEAEGVGGQESKGGSGGRSGNRG